MRQGLLLTSKIMLWVHVRRSLWHLAVQQGSAGPRTSSAEQSHAQQALLPATCSSAVAGTPAAGLLSGLSWVQGNAEQLPFPDACMDSYTVAFGIRNMTNRHAALCEAHRVLKRGGRLLCLEFSHVSLPLLKQLYDLYSFNVIPKIGGLVAKDEASYQYLVESIRQFPDQVGGGSCLLWPLVVMVVVAVCGTKMTAGVRVAAFCCGVSAVGLCGRPQQLCRGRGTQGDRS